MVPTTSPSTAKRSACAADANITPRSAARVRLTTKRCSGLPGRVSIPTSAVPGTPFTRLNTLWPTRVSSARSGPINSTCTGCGCWMAPPSMMPGTDSLVVTPARPAMAARAPSMMSSTVAVRVSLAVVMTWMVNLEASRSTPTVVITSVTSGTLRNAVSAVRASASVPASAMPAGASNCTLNLPWSPGDMNSAPMKGTSAIEPTNKSAAPAMVLLRHRSATFRMARYSSSIHSKKRVGGP